MPPGLFVCCGDPAARRQNTHTQTASARGPGRRDRDGGERGPPGDEVARRHLSRVDGISEAATQDHTDSVSPDDWLLRPRTPQNTTRGCSRPAATPPRAVSPHARAGRPPIAPLRPGGPGPDGGGTAVRLRWKRSWDGHTSSLTLRASVRKSGGWLVASRCSSAPSLSPPGKLSGSSSPHSLGPG